MKYYIHDKSRGCIGNSMLWRKHDHHGYTCDVLDAHEFTEEELPEYLESDDLVAFPVNEIDCRVSQHMDIFQIPNGIGISGKDLKPK